MTLYSQNRNYTISYMSPVEMHTNEVQFYASPILVKNQQYSATLTNERLILEGNGPTREFKVTSLVSAKPVTAGYSEPAVEITLSTPSGQKEMIWTFPVDPVFKAGEQSAWVENIEKASGKADMPLREAGTVPVSQTRFTSGTNGKMTYPAPSYQRGETEVLCTAGVRIKRAYYTLYLTNLRLILQNNLGKIGREFSVAEITDAMPMPSETDEPSIALSIGAQAGMKQMLLTFPTEMSRDAWIRELQVHLPSRKPVAVSRPESATTRAKIGTFVPAANEHLMESTKDVRIKNNFVILHLTNTRFVIEGRAGIVGEFATSTLIRCVRMAGELGEPGLSLSIRGRDGDREMHLVFQSMDERERWILLLENVIPKDMPPAFTPPVQQYTVTTVNPPKQQNSATRYCPVCGARNHIDDTVCGMCGSSLVSQNPDEPEFSREKPDKRERPPKQEKVRRERVKREKVRKERAAYNGGIIGFITRPSDAFVYYSHESPKDALPTFLLSGGICAVIMVLIIAFLLPNVLQLDTEVFPIFSALADNPMLLIIFILILYIMWLVFVLLCGLFTGILAHLFDPNTSVSEILAVVMRTSMTHAVIGWIPVLGTFIASLWSGICSWRGIAAGQNMGSGGAFIASFFGIILMFVVIFVLGIIDGGF